MTPRYLRILGLCVLVTVLFLPSPGDGDVYAQGRNVFDVRKSSSSPASSRPKSDDATRDRLNQAFQKEFTTGFGEAGTYLYYLVFLVFLGVLIGVLVYYDIHRRRSEQPGFDNPKYLFRELCAAHHLTAVERRFLRDFAEELDLEDPLPLFIEPRYFYDALNDHGHGFSVQMIRYLLVKLFDIKLAKEKKADPGHKGPKSADQHSQTTIYVPSQGHADL